MTERQVYAIGADDLLNGPVFNPSRGSGGAFANALQGFTPKYARNQGPREVQQKNTMARMYIDVPTRERRDFIASITDPNLRQFILPNLIGTPGKPASDLGYMDFFLQQISCSIQEKYQVVETLSDNYVAYYFGQSAPVWQYSGELLNTVQDDQLSAWVRMYVAVLRGTQLARRGKNVRLRYDNFIVEGTIFNTAWQHNAQNEMRVQFSFNLLVKNIRVVNFTAGWRPTGVEDDLTGAFQDPHLVVANSPDGLPPQGNVILASGATSQGGTATTAGQTNGAPQIVTNPPAPPPTNRSRPTNPNQNGRHTTPGTQARSQVTGQPPEALGTIASLTPTGTTSSTRPQDNTNGQSEQLVSSGQLFTPMRNGQQAPNNLASLTR